ncbi:MAG TPA: hypothetical protein PLF23_01220, partial [Candidatus Obscuribacter sp.]|nr:hypothetical protein [Candidatus Obscuribacter sp.]
MANEGREFARSYRDDCTKWVPVLVSLSLLVIVLQRLVYWFLHPLFVDSDQSVYLAMAKLILQGKVPYRDFFDFNPPLVMYLNIIPVMVAHLFRIPDPLALSMTMEALHLVSTSFMALIIYRYRQYVPALVFVPFLFVYAYFTTTLENDMGQREHFFTLIFLPFLVLRGLRYAGANPGKIMTAGSGLLCGLVLCLKPQFLFLAVLAEIGFLIGNGALRNLKALEMRFLPVAPLCYLVGLLALPVDCLRIYLEQALPVYTYGISWSSKCFSHMLAGFEYFLQPFCQVTLALFLAFCLLLWESRSVTLVKMRVRLWLMPLIFLCLGSMFNYIQGGQAWTYRLLPMALFAQLLLGFELGVLLSVLLSGSLRRYPALSLPLSILTLLAVSCYAERRIDAYYQEVAGHYMFDLADIGYSGKNPRSDFDATLFSILENSQIGDRIVHIGSGIRPGYPCVLQSRREPGSRYLYFMIVMIEVAREKKPEWKDRFDAIEEKVVQNLGQDILKNKPTLVFLQDLGIRDAMERHNFVTRYLSNYTFIGHVDVTSIYKLTGNKFSPSSISPERRAQIILPILSGAKKVEQVNAETHIPMEALTDWLKRARVGMLSRLTDRTLDREGEYINEINRLNDKLWLLNKEKMNA